MRLDSKSNGNVFFTQPGAIADLRESGLAPLMRSIAALIAPTVPIETVTVYRNGSASMKGSKIVRAKGALEIYDKMMFEILDTPERKEVEFILWRVPVYWSPDSERWVETMDDFAVVDSINPHYDRIHGAKDIWYYFWTTIGEVWNGSGNEDDSDGS